MADLFSDLDSDSLFGSPPPSPRLAEGRSNSLALPCGPHGSAGHENVGTIALPGSHNSSEPVINLPASPPRQHVSSVGAAEAPRVQTRLQTPNNMAPQQPAPRKKRTCRSAASTPPVIESPSFMLPATDQPPPSNFFRSQQQALLGHVGVIAGLNPANLSNRNVRGENSQNPIVVEDENLTALAAWKATSRLRPPLPNGAEPLPRPPSRPPPDPRAVTAVQEMLVRHGAACDVGCCTGDNVLHAQALHVIEKSASEPPTKRRRLDLYRPRRGVTAKPTVPQLSSTDLQQMVKKGKGKSKKMLLHVLSMLKDALEQGTGGSKEDENSNIGGGSGRSHYRPKTARYGIDVLPPEAGGSTSSADAASLDHTQFNPDDTLQSWEQFTPSDDFASYDSSIGSPSPYLPTLPEHVSSVDLESWLAAVNDQLRNGDSSSVDLFGAATLFDSLDVSPTPPSFSNQLPPSLDPSAVAVEQLIGQVNTPNSSSAPVQNDFQQVPMFDSGFPIDSTLLSLSGDDNESSRLLHGAFQNKNGDLMGDMDLMSGNFGMDLGLGSWFSPALDKDFASLLDIPAFNQPDATPMSQLDSALLLSDPPPRNNFLVDPMPTPFAIDQVLSQPIVPENSQLQGVWDIYTSLVAAGLNGASSSSSVPNPPFGEPISANAAPIPDHPLPLSDPTAREPLLDCSTNAAPFTGCSWTIYDPEGLGHGHGHGKKATTVDRSRTRKTVDKEAVLATAKHRREALAVELARAKIELWETTIEQGVLLNLLKDKELDEGSEHIGSIVP